MKVTEKSEVICRLSVEKKIAGWQLMSLGVGLLQPKPAPPPEGELSVDLETHPPQATRRCRLCAILSDGPDRLTNALQTRTARQVVMYCRTAPSMALAQVRRSKG
jgi:hypothetical protein